jgi:hypothetical protein
VLGIRHSILASMDPVTCLTCGLLKVQGQDDRWSMESEARKTRVWKDIGLPKLEFNELKMA